MCARHRTPDSAHRGSFAARDCNSRRRFARGAAATRTGVLTFLLCRTGPGSAVPQADVAVLRPARRSVKQHLALQSKELHGPEQQRSLYCAANYSTRTETFKMNFRAISYEKPRAVGRTDLQRDQPRPLPPHVQRGADRSRRRSSCRVIRVCLEPAPKAITPSPASARVASGGKCDVTNNPSEGLPCLRCRRTTHRAPIRS